MSFFHKLIHALYSPKAAAGLLNDIVPNEIKPVVKVGLALIPGVGPALSAAYTAADAWGGGASLGKSLGEGAKSFAISQVAGVASRSLGVTSGGNDLTDALGQTKGEGVLGLSGTSSAAATTLGTTSTAAPAVSALDEALKAPSSTGITAGAADSASKVAGASGGIFSLDNISKGAAIAGGVGAAASLLTGQKMPAMPGAVDSTGVADQAAIAAEEEQRRKRKGASSNVYTSPLGLVNSGQSAASVLLG